jgi:hypothetical protein
MLTIAPDARTYALNNGGTLFLEYFALWTGGCCIPYQPEPSVRLGKPYNQDKYRQETIDGLTIFIPHELPEVPLLITMSSFMGIKRLVVEGWRHF